MSGLSNPRGLSFGSDGTLYVAEAGQGGGTLGQPFGTSTFGMSGGISARNGNDAQMKLLTGLPSIATPTGGDAAGANDVLRLADGKLAVLFGFSGGLNERSPLGADGSKLGTLSIYDPTSHTWSTSQDYAALETGVNPDGGEINSDPFSFIQTANGFAVADAGANAIWYPGGYTSIPGQMGTAPWGAQIPMESVPTSILARPGGGYVVGELTGFPFEPGKARIHQIAADGTYLGSDSYGLTNIIDMTYASDGSLLVLEHVANGLLNGGPGDVKRIRADGTVDTLITGLITPTSVAFGADGKIYVTNDAYSVGGGQVLRYGYQPVPEPASIAAIAIGIAGVLRRRRK